MNEIVFEPRDGAAREPATVGRAEAFERLEADSAPAAPVQRLAQRRRIHLDLGVVWERLTAASDHEVDFLFVRYPSGAASTPPDALMRHSERAAPPGDARRRAGRSGLVRRRPAPVAAA